MFLQQVNHSQRVGALTANTLSPNISIDLGTKGTSELDDRSWIGILTGVSNECIYGGCLQESAW